MTAIIAALGGIRATVFAGLLILALALAGIQTARLSSAQHERDDWRTAAQAGLAANQTNQATIADLRRVNADWAKKCTFDPAASGEAANKAAENRDALPRDDQRRQEERETMIYDRDQTAAEWGRTSVPAAVADRLRR